MIQVQRYTKKYRDFTAVSDLSFEVPAGKIVGLVGMNGAGKTTTLSAVCGVLTPTSGSILIGGHDIQKNPVPAKQLLAYVPDESQVYDLLTVTEHLHFTALAYRVENAERKYDALLDELELSHKRHEVASTLSRGMMQKLSLACAFLHDPKVVIMDEPLTGLDPKGIRNIKESIRARADAGMAFLISSHLLDLVEKVCDSVIIMHRGRKVADGSLGEIRANIAADGNASLEDMFFSITETSAATPIEPHRR